MLEMKVIVIMNRQSFGFWGNWDAFQALAPRSETPFWKIVEQIGSQWFGDIIWVPFGGANSRNKEALDLMEKTKQACEDWIQTFIVF